MAKGRLEFNTFVKGLITEAGPLTYPEGASLDEANFVLNRDGSRQRRFGIDYEDNHVLYNFNSVETSNVIATHRWENADNAGGFDIAVVQDGSSLTFFNANATSVSADILNGGSSISTGFASNVEISTATINGKFYITGGSKEVTEFTYDRNSENVTKRTFAIDVRDLWGVDDGLAVDFRPTTLSNKHEYNLRNQSWVEVFKCGLTAGLDKGEWANTDPLTNTKDLQGIYPSNADLIHQFKASTTEGVSSINSYDSFALVSGAEGTAAAPKGSIILNSIWNRGSEREANSTASDLPLDKADGVVSSVAAYAGRLFYSFEQTSLTDGDENSPNLNTLIAFSQVGTENAARCYSRNDPSAETFNEPLATDGGFIVIPEMGQVYDMQPLGNSLFVLTSNGVWEINGGENVFSATNQNISKVSNIGALSRKGLLAAENGLAYWARGGIYVISIDDVSLRGRAANITQASIQGLYDEIPARAKRQVSAIYDNVSRQMRWLYRDKSLVDNSLYNKELIFDLNLTAFYVNEFNDLPGSGQYAYPAGYVDVADVLITKATPVGVTDEGIEVTDGGVSLTSEERTIEESVRLSTKYLGAINDGTGWKYTICQLGNTNYVDWVQVAGGVDSPARLLTGYWTGGVSTKDKRSPYLFTHFRRTEQGWITTDGGFDPIGASGCTVQAPWEWTDSANAGKWGTSFQAYKLPRNYNPADISDDFDFGYTVVTTKNKLRGGGNALSLSFTSEPGKDCHIYGWAFEIVEEDS
jgi:hypothetical protein